MARYLLTVVHLVTTGFALTASHFLFACAKEKVTKEKAHPTSGSGYARLPLLRHCSEGRHGGASLAPRFSLWLPCPTPLYTAPPLGLLTGQGIAAPANIVGAVLTAKLLIRQPTHQRWRQA